MRSLVPSACTLVLALAVGGTAGCVSVAAPPRSYLLTAATEGTPSGAPHGPVVVVGPVTIPAYLDRSPLVVRGAGDEVTISADHQWAEPLGDAVARVLAENLSAMIPTDCVVIFPWRITWTTQFRVTVDITRLDGPLGGPAILAARWRLLDGSGRALAFKAVAVREAVTGPSHAALVAAQSRLLAALSRDIAAEIRSHPP